MFLFFYKFWIFDILNFSIFFIEGFDLVMGFELGLLVWCLEWIFEIDFWFFGGFGIWIFGIIGFLGFWYFWYGFLGLNEMVFFKENFWYLGNLIFEFLELNEMDFRNGIFGFLEVDLWIFGIIGILGFGFFWVWVFSRWIFGIIELLNFWGFWYGFWFMKWFFWDFRGFGVFLDVLMFLKWFWCWWDYWGFLKWKFESCLKFVVEKRK